MAEAKTLTPTLSREREREETGASRDRSPALTPTLSRMREREEASPANQAPMLDEAPSPLSRLRERARVRARALRHSQTDAESLLWYRLRNRQLLGLKFRRQRPIGPYIADFACLEIGLIIELDGGQHAEQLAYDEQRAAVMQENGFQTLRFWNNDVLTQTDSVMEKILQVAQTLTPTLSREREREKTGASRDHSPALTPTLSRERERE